MDGVDEAIVRLFLAGCFHQWEHLPELGRSCYSAGCTVEQVRGCVRHLIVVAGYAPCLAATNHLKAAKLLDHDSPGKVAGKPGNAFDLVYGKNAAVVQHRLYEVDPVLAEYIRLHQYGDIYSSPGLSLRQKQLLMCAFLGAANIHEQLFGHTLAALKFGNSKEACLEAVDMGFESAPFSNSTTYKAAVGTFEMAFKKFKREFPNGAAPEPEICIEDPSSICVPQGGLLQPPPDAEQTLKATKAPIATGQKDPGQGLTILTAYAYDFDVDGGLGGLGGLPTP